MCGIHETVGEQYPNGLQHLLKTLNAQAGNEAMWAEAGFSDRQVEGDTEVTYTVC